jgi:hypothetical protein
LKRHLKYYVSEYERDFYDVILLNVGEVTINYLIRIDFKILVDYVFFDELVFPLHVF